MKKVRTIGFLKVSITNRGIYTLSLFALAVVLAILVYAVSGTFAPGSTPNPGHPPSELGIPSPCNPGQFLEYANSSVGWVCGTGSLWAKSGNNIYYNSGYVGIGTTNPDRPLVVRENSGYGKHTAIFENSAGYGVGIGYLQDFNEIGIQAWGAGSPRSLILQSSGGNVGIGTTNPVHVLDVIGSTSSHTAFFGSPSGASVGIGSLNNGNYGSIQAWEGSSSRSLVLQTLGGNVGIGTTNPTSKLEVNGDIKADSGIILGGVRRTSWPSVGTTTGYTGDIIYSCDSSTGTVSYIIFKNGLASGIGSKFDGSCFSSPGTP